MSEQIVKGKLENVILLYDNCIDFVKPLRGYRVDHVQILHDETGKLLQEIFGSVNADLEKSKQEKENKKEEETNEEVKEEIK